MNNTDNIQLDTLTPDQLNQLLFNIQAKIGQLEIEKQIHLNSYAQVALEVQKRQVPKLKKINLPKQLDKADEATYTLNKQ